MCGYLLSGKDSKEIDFEITYLLLQLFIRAKGAPTYLGFFTKKLWYKSVRRILQLSRDTTSIAV